MEAVHVSVFKEYTKATVLQNTPASVKRGWLELLTQCAV